MKFRLPTTFTRAVIATALARENSTTHRAGSRPSDPETLARALWGPQSGVDRVLKEGVGAVSSSDPMATGGRGDDEFFASVVEASVPGRLAGLRGVPFNVRLLKMDDTARGYWVGEFRPIPLSKPSMAGSSLPRRKIGAIICSTLEALQAANTAAESRFEDDLRRAVVGALDESFLDPANTGVAGEMPASITSGASPIPSQGDPASDIETLIAGFTGDLSQAYLITDPLTASQIALARDAGGSFAFPDVGPRGGSILQIPTLTTRWSPRDSTGGQLVLVDPSGIAAALEGVEIARSTAASLIMADDPDASDNAGELVSLFTTETVALKAIIYANWEVQRSGGVSVVTGCNYSVSQS